MASRVQQNTCAGSRSRPARVRACAGRARAGADQERAASAWRTPGGAAQQGRRLAVQYVRAGVAADHHGRIGARQVGETRRPEGSRRAQAVVGHLLQGRGVVQHVRSPGSRYCGVVTTRSKFSIRPRATDVHQADALVGVRLIHRQGGSLRRPAEMIRSGQGGASGLGLVPNDAEQGERRQQIGQKLGRTVDQVLDLERPAEAFGERADLRVVPGLVAHHHPGPGMSGADLAVSNGCHQEGVSSAACGDPRIGGTDPCVKAAHRVRLYCGAAPLARPGARCQPPERRALDHGNRSRSLRA